MIRIVRVLYFKPENAARRGVRVSAPYFVKIAEGGKRDSQVALVRTDEDLRTIKPFLREAFNLAAVKSP
jgi:hypothetical protein